MSAAVHLVRDILIEEISDLVYVHFSLATYVIEILLQSTNTDTGEMITPA